MSGGCDRNVLHARVDAGGDAEAEDGRKLFGELGADGRVRVEADGAPALLLFEDGARDDVARRQLGVGVQCRHEAFAEIVDERGALAAHRLGDERHGIAPDRERGGMELNELHVGEQRARARRHRDAVSGGFDGVGGVAVEASHPARRQHDGAGTKR